MGTSEIITLALSGAYQIGQLIASAVADRNKSVEELRAQAHAKLDELIATAAGMRAIVESDDLAALEEIRKKIGEAGQ